MGEERKNGAIWQKAVTATETAAASASESDANGIKAKRNDEMPSLAEPLDDDEGENQYGSKFYGITGWFIKIMSGNAAGLLFSCLVNHNTMSLKFIAFDGIQSKKTKNHE